MIKILDKIIFVVSILAVIGLTGAYLARFVNPNTFIVPSLLGLAYPYLLLSNFILLLYWITRWKKMAIVILAVIALGIPFFMTYYGTSGSVKSNTPHDFSILSYNVRYFDRYGWTKNKNTKNRLLDYLNRYKGNMICLQEFPLDNYSITPQEIIRELSTYKYHYIHKNMAIFSRIPIVNSGKLNFDEKYTSACIFCDIIRNKDTIRIYNVHLESYKMGQKERKFMKEISEGSSNDISGGIKNITVRLIRANKDRARQARQIKSHLNQSPHPLIVCGDFNDTPLSYTYKVIDDELTDSFIEKGHGLGNTYIGEFPSFRIDYILHSPTFRTVSYTRGSSALSDHYPISCELQMH